jgi:hypothetical protein
MAWVASTIISIVVGVISVGYSVYSGLSAQAAARKSKREADANADRAKGFQLVVEGSSEACPIVFGRNKVGGVRVHSTLTNSYLYAATPANQMITLGGSQPLHFRDASQVVGSLGVSGNILSKAGVASKWDTFGFSERALREPSAQCILNSGTNGVLFGFAETNLASIRSLSYGWLVGKDGKAWVFHNSLVNSPGKVNYLFDNIGSFPTLPSFACSVNTALAVRCEADGVNFYLNEVKVYTISGQITSAYAMVAFRDPGASIKSVSITGKTNDYDTFAAIKRDQVRTLRFMNTDQINWGGTWYVIEETPNFTTVPAVGNKGAYQKADFWVASMSSLKKSGLGSDRYTIDWAKPSEFFVDVPKTDYLFCYFHPVVPTQKPSLELNYHSYDLTTMSTQASMVADIAGTKREFLFTQQVLTEGSLTSVVACDVDGNPYNSTAYKYGLMLQIHLAGGVPNSLMTLNDASRKDSRFTSVAYATGCFRLNRDNPQFNGIPEVQFYVEGNPCMDTDGLAELQDKSYSNNPARVLLEYLRNPLFKGLLAEQVHLKSFQKVKTVCDRLVIDEVNSTGAFWKAKRATKQIKRFECNLTLSSADSHRTNINKILSTMGGMAELIWSAGKYKLQLEYPMLYDVTKNFETDVVVQVQDGDRSRLFRSTSEVNSGKDPLTNPQVWAEDVLVGTITDDNLLIDSQLVVTWPSLDTKLNLATVRFLNEEKDFKEDSVSWPEREPVLKRLNVTFTISLDGTVTFSEKVTLKAGSKFYAGDSLTGLLFTTTQDAENINIVGITLPWVDDVNAQTAALLAAGSLGYVYQQFDSGIYQAYLEADGFLHLEDDSFADGIVTVHHAKALAEQKVRLSRHTTNYKFDTTTEFYDLEPGDLMGFESEVFEVPYTILKVNKVDSAENGKLSVEASSFDARLLAWNIDDDLLENFSADDRTVVNRQVTNLRISESIQPSGVTKLRLAWDVPEEPTPTYRVQFTRDNAENITSSTVWVELGTTGELFYWLPWVEGPLTLTVVSITADGRIPEMVNLEDGNQWPFLQIEMDRRIPGNVEYFNVAMQGDGTRVYDWSSVEAYPNLAGYVIRYTSGLVADDTPAWADMLDLQEGLLTAAPFESNRLSVGDFTFAIVAKDFDGFTSSVPKYAEVTLGEARGRIAGLDGVGGAQGPPGTSSFFHVAYADSADGTVNFNEIGGSYIGTYVDTAPLDSIYPQNYTWRLFKGVDGTDGIPGTNGVDGQTSYLHLKYSNDGTTFTANGGETAGDWLGQRVDFVLADSTTFSDYTWKKIKGADGIQGLTGTTGTPGNNGTNGATSYFHVAYANSSDGSIGFNQSTGTYIGTYVDFTVADSNSYSAYTWRLLKGADGTNGIAGTDGTDGQTSYLHIKYSNDGTTFTASGGEVPGTWIGQYVDFVSTDSSSFGVYSWSKIKGVVKSGTSFTGTPTEGDIWIDTSSSPTVIKVYLTGAWSAAANNITAGTVTTSLIASNAVTDFFLSSLASDTIFSSNTHTTTTEFASGLSLSLVNTQAVAVDFLVSGAVAFTYGLSWAFTGSGALHLYMKHGYDLGGSPSYTSLLIRAGSGSGSQSEQLNIPFSIKLSVAANSTLVVAPKMCLELDATVTTTFNVSFDKNGTTILGMGAKK